MASSIATPDHVAFSTKLHHSAESFVTGCRGSWPFQGSGRKPTITLWRLSSCTPKMTSSITLGTRVGDNNHNTEDKDDIGNTCGSMVATRPAAVSKDGDNVHVLNAMWTSMILTACSCSKHECPLGLHTLRYEVECPGTVPGQSRRDGAGHFGGAAKNAP